MPLPLVAAAAAPAASPWLAPAVAGGASLLGGLATSAFNMFQADKSRDFNRESAQHAHQYEVADLRAAGLNPILSAKGSGASVAPSPTAQSGNFDTSQGILQGMQIRNQLELQKAQIRDTNSAAALKEIEGGIALRTMNEKTDSIREALYKLRSESDLSASWKERFDREMRKMDIQNELDNLDKTHSALGLSQARSDSKFNEGIGGDIERWLRMLGLDLPEVMKHVPYKRYRPERR